MNEKLDASRINSELAHLPGWTLQNGELVRTLVFSDFVQAMQFVNTVAQLAENAGHHPDIDIRYNKVRLVLVTHDAGGITAKDIDLAKAIGREHKVSSESV